MNVLLLVALFSAAEFANGVPPVNFGNKPDPNPCCFRYGIGAKGVACCFGLISCDEHDEIKNGPPLLGGAIGKHHFCPKDAEHARQLASGTSDDNQCCFQYGFGARQVPCCLNVITCDEHDKLLEEVEEHPEQRPVGGAIGKHHFCPSNASHAHQLLSATHISPEIEITQIDSCFDCGITMCPSGNRAICCEASKSCECPEKCPTEDSVTLPPCHKCCSSPEDPICSVIRVSCSECSLGPPTIQITCGTVECENGAECCQTCDGQGNLIPANRCSQNCPQPLCIPAPEDPNPCCFRYGFGARMVPCCLDLISCDEHDEIKNDGPIPPGGAIGKHHFCPNNAEHAHQLASGCECGAQCEMSGGGSGLCQEDGKTCAQNIVPPNCPAPSTPKQVGESCGYSRLQNCGDCADGLECDTLVEDRCGVCKNKPDEQRPKCKNPGKSVPSPFDSCNTCRCSDAGVIEGCTRRFCPEEKEKPNNNPYGKLLYCKKNDPNYCEEKTDGEFNFCHPLPQPSCFFEGETVNDCYGICVPEEESCDETKPCESIGNKDSGLLRSKCKNGKCVFSRAIIIA